MEQNIVEPDRPQITTWRMRIERWIGKATDTHSERVMPMDFPLQQWLLESASMLHLLIITYFVYNQNVSRVLL